MNYRLISSFLPVFFGVIVSCTGQSLQFVEEDGLIKLTDDQRHVFSYQIETKSLDGQYPRANYVHPLNDFTGTPLTEDFPEDHLHQRGIFWTWHQLYLDGDSIADPWVCEGIQWKVEHIKHKTKNNQAVLTADVTWLVGENNQKMIREDIQITYQRGTDDYYLLDFDIKLLALEDNLELGGSNDIKGYGGFSARLDLGDKVTFFNKSGDIVPQNEQLQAGNWIGIRDIGINHSNLAIMYHPKSTATLSGWILRKSKSMQNPVWPGRERVVLNKGDQFNLKARLVVFRGETKEKIINDIYENYITQ